MGSTFPWFKNQTQKVLMEKSPSLLTQLGHQLLQGIFYVHTKKYVWVFFLLKKKNGSILNIFSVPGFLENSISFPIFIFIYLFMAALRVACGTSLTRDGTRAPCSGSAES